VRGREWRPNYGPNNACAAVQRKVVDSEGKLAISPGMKLAAEKLRDLLLLRAIV
jgi:hypothetical protein